MQTAVEMPLPTTVRAFYRRTVFTVAFVFLPPLFVAAYPFDCRPVFAMTFAIQPPLTSAFRVIYRRAVRTMTVSLEPPLQRAAHMLDRRTVLAVQMAEAVAPPARAVGFIVHGFAGEASHCCLGPLTLASTHAGTIGCLRQGRICGICAVESYSLGPE